MSKVVKDYMEIYESVRGININGKVNEYLEELGKKLEECCQCPDRGQKCKMCKTRKRVEIVCEELMRSYEEERWKFLFKGDSVEVEEYVFHFLSSYDEMVAAIASAAILQELEVKEERKWRFREVEDILEKLQEENLELREKIYFLKRESTWRGLQNYACEKGIKVLFMMKLLDEKQKILPRQMWVVWLRKEDEGRLFTRWTDFVREKQKEICEVLKINNGEKKSWQLRVEGVHSLVRGNGEEGKFFKPTLLDDLPFLKKKFWDSLSVGRKFVLFNLCAVLVVVIFQVPFLDFLRSSTKIVKLFGQ